MSGECVRLKLVTGTTFEPVPRKDAKEWLRIDEEETGDDALIDGLITTARTRIEEYTKRALIIQTFDAYLTAFPASGDPIELPRSPLVSVASIKGFTDTDATDTGGTSMNSSEYYVDTASEPGQIVPFAGYTYPTDSRVANPAIIRFTAGYTSSSGASAVPARFKTAIKKYVARLYEHRGDDDQTGSATLPPDVRECLEDDVLPEWG